MYKIKFLLLVSIILNISLFAYNDSDMDGVEDQFDQCQNTPFSELVNKNGCSINSSGRYTIMFGLSSSSTSYDEEPTTNTSTKSIQLTYKKDNISLQASTSYYNLTSDSYSESGLNDTFLGLNYKLNSYNELTTTIGFGVILPTYDTTLNNNNTDYLFSANFDYPLQNSNVFGGYSYTIINDSDIEDTVAYQNTNSYSVGIGYNPTKITYLSVSYNQSDSVYTNVDDIKTLSIFGLYTIDSKWFTTLTYTNGLSDTASDYYTTIKIGYNF